MLFVREEEKMKKSIWKSGGRILGVFDQSIEPAQTNTNTNNFEFAQAEIRLSPLKDKQRLK